MTGLPALEPLPPVSVESIELVRVSLPLARRMRTARSGHEAVLPTGAKSRRSVLLVHVRAAEAEGWAECATESSPTYSSEYTDSAQAVLVDHLIPRAWAGPTGDVLALAPHLDAVRGHRTARACLELAVLDAQLRASDRSLAAWLGATSNSVIGGAALGMHDTVEDLLAEADAALGAGAVRLRAKITPGRAAGPLEALRTHCGGIALQADANGSFDLHDPMHIRELHQLDGVGLTCLEQPLAPEDLLGHAELARRLATPICLDEPLTSLGSIEAAVALGACEVVCLKPARVGGWVAARRIHDRCLELGIPVWVGGMLETGLGRAANAAVAALPGMVLPPDLDPRPRYEPDLTRDGLGVGGAVRVPDDGGTGAVPDPAMLVDARVSEVPP